MSIPGIKIPDIKLYYPSGEKALEVIGVDGNIVEFMRLGPGLFDVALQQIPKLQPLMDEFYQIYQKIKKVD